MLPAEFRQMYEILSSFLGEAKGGFDGERTQLQFGCPNCIEKHGESEHSKYNLECNFFVYHCWKCSSEDDYMSGNVLKLIKKYGNDDFYNQYRKCIQSLKSSKLYKIDFIKDFNVDIEKIDTLSLPKYYRSFKQGKYYPKRALEYLQKRGIDWPIIEQFNIGFTTYQEDDTIRSNRIILPSYGKYGELNYWTGRDFTGNDKRQKYCNPKVERKDIIFNEEYIQWDADITLVEGPFDHIVVPNSIPLLGKVLNKDFKLYWEIKSKAKANINIFLDGDAFESVVELYKSLNHDNLYGKIRFIPVDKNYDPSLLFQLGGRETIMNHLSNAMKIKEEYLF